MIEGPDELLRVRGCPALHEATLVLAFKARPLDRILVA